MRFVVKEKTKGEKKFNQSEYVDGYRRENIKQIGLGINRVTEADLLEWLDQQENKQGHIKQLIREDMERKKKDE